MIKHNSLYSSIYAVIQGFCSPNDEIQHLLKYQISIFIRQVIINGIIVCFLLIRIERKGPDLEQIVVLSIFFVTYFFIISGKINRSLIAVAMGLLVMFTKVAHGLTISEIGNYVDFNTIGILIGMMILVGILKTTGLFQYIAALIVKNSKGRMFVIFITLLIAVAFFSSVLDNVTTILLFAPIVFLITDTAGINPTPIIFSMIFAANIGGMATIVGDPPNILVGSASGSSFIEFSKVMALPSVLILLASVVFLRFKYPEIKKVPASKLERLMDIDPSKAIENKSLFIKGIVVFAFVILGFVLHATLHYEASLIAFSGAVVLMLLSKTSFEHISPEIEWDTIFFFIGLFMLSKALEEVGIIHQVAEWLYTMNSNPLVLIIMILWISAVLGGFIGAVPVVTVFIPIIHKLLPMIPNGGEMWWALALGACIGGNLTISGAAANMVAVGLVEKTILKKISFMEFFKVGITITLIGLVIATCFLIARWYMI